MLEEVMYGLIDLLGPIANFKNIHRQLADEALNAISKALNETSLYYRDIELGITPDPSQEKKAMLVRLWESLIFIFLKFVNSNPNIG